MPSMRYHHDSGDGAAMTTFVTITNKPGGVTANLSLPT